MVPASRPSSKTTDALRLHVAGPLRHREEEERMGFFGNKWDFVLAGGLIAAAIVAIVYFQR